MLTDRATEHFPSQARDRVVEVESLERFVQREAAPLSQMIAQYYDWLQLRGSRRFKRVAFDPSRATVEGFLRAVRLNPKSQFPYLVRVLPGTPPSPADTTVPIHELSPHEDANRHFEFRFRRTPLGTRIPARAVLHTYCDEPDWQIDHGLWSISEYGYGKIPFGSAQDMTDRVPFHMQFDHENFFVNWIAPEVRDGMAYERVELFVRLARLALKSHHPYWGYRFAAWALHYVQDIGQPYHAKAVPSESFWFYLRFLFSWNKSQFKQDTARRQENRHIGFEDMTASLLQARDARMNPAFNADSEREAEFALLSSAKEVFDLTSRRSVEQAAAVDLAMTPIFGERMHRVDYRATDDSGFDHVVFMSAQPHAIQDTFITEASLPLRVTGSATRALIRIIEHD